MSPKPLSQLGGSYGQSLAQRMTNPLTEKKFKRILAERDIAPELDQPNEQNPVSSDGKGVTNIIQNFINKAKYPRELVEETLLKELNYIFSPDGYFKRIVCQQSEGGMWEIYLEEDSKGMVPLSNSGSGIKTIIMVLVYIYLVPAIEEKSSSINYVFAFEELENNMHPALLRRLLEYIYNKSKNDKVLFFLTTHSSVAIDFFNKNPDAQIIHVTHNGNNASCRTVKTYIQNMNILDDLDVRASDLLQSNGVIWLEGPSDRIYIKKWIDLWSDGELKEGTHYQCVFYGGRLLYHLSAASPDDTESGVSIFRKPV